jgi:ribosomal protein L11 methyltransferase
MICSMLLDMPLKGKRVLDCGCGTGILGICAVKLGAESVVGYDIDEWSSDNTRHNAVINQVDNRMTALCGDASVLSNFGAEFDVVLANINRNILLNDMERFRSVMAPKAQLILSGFYKEDCALLESKAQSLGLSLQATHTDGDWACLAFILS